MKALICERCGGKINRNTMTCEFCGTQYAYEENRIVFVREDPRFKALYVKGDISKHVYRHECMDNNGTDFLSYVIEDLAHQLAEGLVPYMEVETEDNPIRDSISIRARIRVARPDVRLF